MWFLILAVFILFMFLFYAAVEKGKSDNQKTKKEDCNVSNQQVVNHLQDFVAGYSLEQPLDFKIDKELERYRSKLNWVVYYITSGCSSVEYNGWLSLGNGKYFMEKDHYIYDMSDKWKRYCRYYEKDKEAFYNIIKDATIIETCKDPHKTYWEYFLEQEMLSKKQREVDCHNYINEVLQKQVEYNDLQINYQMLPSAPITDVESFRNFCKVVHEDTKYEDYEIQNYLLLKKSMQ